MIYTLANKPIGRIGFGMMGLTFPGKHPPTSEAIATLKAALEMGANFWNAGEHYGTPDDNSLHLLKAYFTQYPEDVDRVVISVRSCFNFQARKPEVDAASVKASIEQCLESVGLSECSGASIRKAATITRISAVEVELSLFETGIYRNGVTDACRECGIPIVAYGPLSRGFLSGQWRSYDDMPEDDIRKKMFPRFQREVFAENVRLVDEVAEVARRNACSNVQVALAWVLEQSEKIGVPVVPIPGASSIARVRENMRDVELPQAELEQVDGILERIEVKGARAPPGLEHLMEV